MKNLHYLKKFVVMVLAAMMTLSTFAMPTFAATTKAGTTLEITGFDNTDNVSVKAYKVIKQDDNGDWINMYPSILEGLEYVTGSTDKIKGDVTITQDQIEALATKAQKGDLDSSKVDGDWTANDTKTALTKNLAGSAGLKYGTEEKKGAGMYLVLIENSAKGEAKNADDSTVRVYNPMVISIDPSGANGSLMAGSVDVEDVYNGTANVKSSKPAFDKYIARQTEVAADANKSNITDAEFANTTNLKNGDATNEGKYGDTDTRGGDNDATNPKIGSKVWFEIATTIPAYADNFWYKDASGKDHTPHFKIYDTLSKGLDLQKSEIKVYDKATGAVIDAANYTLDAVDTAGAVNTFTIDFKDSYLKGLGQKDIVVRYPAVVNANCASNFEAETNTARMEYTHKPGEEQSSEQITTYHYTFTINGRLNGEGSTELREVVKVGCTENGEHVFAETEAITNKWKEDIHGATFNLYKDDGGKPATEVYRTAFSDQDGRLVGGKYDANGDGTEETYSGLDRLDAGTYWLVEQSVPSPYKVVDTPIKVEIKANLDPNTGVLVDYEIKVGGKLAGKYKATYSDEEVTINGIDKDAEENVAVIKKPTAFQGHDGNDWLESKNAGQVAKYEITGDKPVAPVRAEGETDAAWNKRMQTYREALNMWYATKNDPTAAAADIRNTETGTLPSTGGMGTVLFTIGGALIMALALFILFGGKKKQHQK